MKGNAPQFALMALEETPAGSSRQPFGGFDTVKCKIGSQVFEMAQQWSPKGVDVNLSGTIQRLFWDISTDQDAKKIFSAIQDCNTPVKIQYSSSSMGGVHEFVESQRHVDSIKKMAAVYQDFYK